MTLDVTLMRDIERRRLRALVDADIAVAGPLHADDYQLITPRGYALTKDEYLGSVASGELRYHVFEPASEIAVWGTAEIAVLRYIARILVENEGPAVSISCWHTDCYELREGLWQVVWSQATAINGED